MPREPSSRESKVVESSFLRVSLPPGVHFTVGFEKIAQHDRAIWSPSSPLGL